MEFYVTSDVYLSATLYVLGHQVTAIDRRDPARCLFIFKNTQELQTDVECFWRKGISIEPQTLFASLRSLKWRLHNE